jgi:rhodanese-related sulfurtransferase
MSRVRTLLTVSGLAVATVLLVSGCLSGPAFGLVEEPPGDLPTFGEIEPEEAAAIIVALRDDPEFVLLDIRTPAEVASGHLPGAVSIDFRSADFETEIDALDRESIYLIYCRTANRTGQAFVRMTEMGFTKIYDMQGGITLWAQLGYPVCQGAPGEEHTCVGEYPTPAQGS